MDIFSYRPKGRIEHKHLLNLLDYSTADIYEILHLANSLKTAYKRGKKHELLKGKTIATIFTSPSALSYASFEMAIRSLGAHALSLPHGDELGDEAAIRDTAQVISRYGIDGAVVHTHSQAVVEGLAKYGSFSVINGRTDDFDPCRAISDIFTVAESFGRLNGVKLAYFGDGSAAHSLMLAGAKTGMKICICSPDDYEPNPEITAVSQNFGNVTITDSIEEAAKDAGVIYTDAFFSTDGENDTAKEKALMPYQVNAELLALADKDAIFMHGLPARRGEEVTADVIDSTRSVIFEQAENRLHVQKAIACLLIGKR